MKTNVKKDWKKPHILAKLPIQNTLTLKLSMGGDGGVGNMQYTS
jgi:hypothetical protein